MSTNDLNPPDPIACVYHPEAKATHNCMGCGKPLCMDCVSNNGYYCSDECKAAVREREPDALAAEPQYGEVDQAVEKTMAAAGRLVRGLKWPVVIIVLGVIGYYGYGHFFGPEGVRIAARDVPSLVAQFNVHFVAPDRLLVQANNELFLMPPATGEKDWSIDLTTLEASAANPRARPSMVLAGVTDELLLVAGGSQLVALARDGGQRRWEHTDTNAYLRVLGTHDQGILCGAWRNLVCLDPASGAIRWASTNQNWTAAAAVGFAANQVLFVYEPPPEPAATNNQDKNQPELTAGMFDAKQILRMAGANVRADDPDTDEYIVEAVAIASGAPRGLTRLAFSGSPEFVQAGDRLCLAGGRHLAVFAQGPQPLWQANLKTDFVSVIRGGDTLLVATANGIEARAAQTGERRWERDDLEPRTLAVGPDGAVYAGITIDKKKADEFRYAQVSSKGSSVPFEQVKVLLKLDPDSGETVWGVRHLGEAIQFDGDRLYAIDNTHQMDLLANAGLFTGYISVRQLNPRNGKDLWLWIGEGLLFEHWIADGKAYLVTAEGPSNGRENPRNLYRLEVVAAE